ncbi:MAG: methyltransferase domain-containing protein [Verrucomicrobiota bacterium]|nr:methyltransferase domain-containing protein [Verrucomicrobiota bacterium]
MKQFLVNAALRLGYEVEIHRRPVRSETSRHRDLLQPYCQGYGCDIGFGGDPISAEAIRVDLPTPYTSVGPFKVQLGGDCRNLHWFGDDVLDFVYSSHLLEDFPEPEIITILAEWSRALKPGGRMVLLLPDQQRYLNACRKNGQGPNPHHSMDHFSLAALRPLIARLPCLREVAAYPNLGEYSFAVVLEKLSAVRASPG